MSGFTEAQLAMLQAPLARDHVKQRSQAGRTLSYLEGWRVIDEANRIFGFDGWDRETGDLRCVAERETKIGNPPRDGWRVAYVCKVRIIVRSEVSTVLREGTGYGSGIDHDLGAAHESAAKEAETDATKRALMTFGNQFGLALYDKEQANVEAPQRKLPPAYPSREPATAQTIADAAERVVAEAQARRQGPAPHVPLKDHPKRQQALDAWKLIKTALEKAETPGLIDEIMKINEVSLQTIRDVNPPTYDDLWALAETRKAELRAAA